MPTSTTSTTLARNAGSAQAQHILRSAAWHLTVDLVIVMLIVAALVIGLVLAAGALRRGFRWAFRRD